MSAKFYLVGGALRDRFLGLPSKDFDYTVEAASFEEMEKAILEKGGEIFLSTPKYLTSRARVPALGAADYVLARKDGSYFDGRHPETVEPGTIFDDLARRDFTMNAIAEDVDTGKVIDPFDGRKDIQSKILRAVGEPWDRFNEDKLRILRAIRFAVTKRFMVEPNTYKAMRAFPTLEGVSVERIREELRKAFAADTLTTLNWLHDFSNLQDYIFRETPLWLTPTLEGR